jgi:hypothetical protein
VRVCVGHMRLRNIAKAIWSTPIAFGSDMSCFAGDYQMRSFRRAKRPLSNSAIRARSRDRSIHHVFTENPDLFDPLSLEICQVGKKSPLPLFATRGQDCGRTFVLLRGALLLWALVARRRAF